MMSRSLKEQFGPVNCLLLAAAMAAWCWLFREVTLLEQTVLGSVCVVAGLIGHLVYARWWSYRTTVFVVVLLIYTDTLFLLSLPVGGPREAFELSTAVFVEPALLLLRGNPHGVPFLLGTLIFAPANIIRPSLPTAVVTALGLGMWCMAGLLLMAHAG